MNPIKNAKIEEIQSDIESTKSRLKSLEEDLKLENEMEELKRNLICKIKLLSEHSDEEIGALCRTINLRSLFSALKLAGVLEFERMIFIPEISELNVAEAVCMMSKKSLPRLG